MTLRSLTTLLAVPALVLALALPASATAQEPAGATEPSDDVAVMTAFGGGLAILSYSTAEYLGELAERAKDPAQRNDVRVRLGGLKGGLQVIRQQLAPAVQAVPANERQAVTDLAALVDQLAAEADALEAWLGAPSDATAATFRTKREAAWQGVVRLLGLQGPAAEMLSPGGADLGQ